MDTETKIGVDIALPGAERTVFKDESTGIEYPTLKELQDQRMVKTNDAKGFAYADGNRALRRQIYKQLRTGGGHQTPKQYHKQGHK